MGTICATRFNQDNDSAHTVIIIDESASQAKGKQRFTEKIMPLVLSKLSHEKSQLIHSLTLGTDKTSVVEKLQSMLGTLDANKPIRILVLTDGEVQNHQEIENFAAIIMKFLSASNLSIEFQVVRLVSKSRSKQDPLQTNNPTTKSYLFDIDASESNKSIATRIGQLFQSGGISMDQQLRMDKHTSKVKGRSTPLAAKHTQDVGEKESEKARTLHHVEIAESSPEIKMNRRQRRTCCTIFGFLRIYRFYCYLIFFIIVGILVALIYLGKIKIIFSL